MCFSSAPTKRSIHLGLNILKSCIRTNGDTFSFTIVDGRSGSGDFHGYLSKTFNKLITSETNDKTSIFVMISTPFYGHDLMYSNDVFKRERKKLNASFYYMVTKAKCYIILKVSMTLRPSTRSSSDYYSETMDVFIQFLTTSLLIRSI